MKSLTRRVHRFEAEIVEKVEALCTQNVADQVRVLGKRIGLWRYPELIKALPEPMVLCPDIDLLLGPPTLSTPPEIVGVEVKVIYLYRNKTNVKFYEGLDESLALLRFGVDRVLFFQIFLIPGDGNGQLDQMAGSFIHYPKALRDLIRTTNMPIAYTPAFDVVVRNQLLPGNIQVLDINTTGNNPEEDQLILRTRGANPFLSSSTPRYTSMIREFLLSKFVFNAKHKK